MSPADDVSDLSRLLSSIRWTLETHVAPNVQGSLAQSYVRTLLMLLEHAERKAKHDWHFLREDLADLDAVFQGLGLSDGRGPVDVSSLGPAALEAEIAARDSALSRALPSLDAGQREAFDGFVLRRIARQRRFLPDTPPAGSF